MGYNHVAEIFDVDWLFAPGLHLCANLSKTFSIAQQMNFEVMKLVRKAEISSRYTGKPKLGTCLRVNKKL